MRSKKDPRHKSRILSVMELYNFFFDTSATKSHTNIEGLGIYKNYSKELYKELVNGTKTNVEEIDEIVDSISNPIKTKDLDALSLAIIRQAVYEGFLAKITPTKVAVDEAIELAKDFGESKNAKKISGILGKIYEHFRKIDKKSHADDDKDHNDSQLDKESQKPDSKKLQNESTSRPSKKNKAD